MTVTGTGARWASVRTGVGEAVVGQRRWVDPPARARGAPRSACWELLLALHEQLLGGRVDVAAEELPGPMPEREEPLLGAVVEVALESPPLLVAGADDPGA